MNIFKRIKRRIEYTWAIKSSKNYIAYLRNEGLSVGKDCFFQSPKTARVICTIDEYYRKRKEYSLLEASALAQTIYKKRGRRPKVEEMWEEFPFWLDGNQDDSRLRFSVSYQTKGFNEFWRKKHKATFKSFEEFIDAALSNQNML